MSTRDDSVISDDTILEDSRKTQNAILDIVSPYSTPKGWLFDITLPVIPLLVFCLTKVITEFETNKHPLFLSILFILITVSIITLITMPLVNNLKLQLKEQYAKIDAENVNLANISCKRCIELRKFNALNSYNIFTYDQILQIEKNVGDYSSSSDKAIYIYSTYRDEGEAGYPAANEVMEYNKKRGIVYYEIFYKNSHEKLGTEVNSIDLLNNEITIDLSRIIIGEENLSKCLDYQFYQHSRFGIIIYQWNTDRVDGYFCINFPIIGLCRSYVDSSECPMNCTLGNADRMKKVFYKKMPNAITQSLHSRLKQFVQSK